MFKAQGVRTLAIVRRTLQTAACPLRPTTQRIRLLPIPRAALPDHFYTPQKAGGGGERAAGHRLFRLSLRPLSATVLYDINAGPTWLRGEYPAGLLKKRHERRRPINDRAQHDGWREDAVDDVEGLAHSTTPTESTLAKRPLLVRATDNVSKPYGRWLPVLVQVSKKGIDKRAVYRNRARTRLLEALRRILVEHADSLPFHDDNGNVLAYIFTPTAEVIKTPIATISEALNEVLRKIKQRPAKNKRPGDRTASFRGARGKKVP